MAEPTSYPAGTIAKFLDLTPRRLRQLVAEGIIPKTDRGRYPLVGAVQGYIKYLRTRADGRTFDPADELQTHKLRLVRWRAELAQIEVERLRGELVPASKLEEVLVFLVTSVRSRLLALPRKLAVTLNPEDPQDAERRIELEVNGILEELAGDDSLPEWVRNGNRNGHSVEPPDLAADAEASSKRVG